MRPFPENMPEDPADLFLDWYGEAVGESVADPDAMTLATSAGDRPSARIVLLKSAGPGGFVFFTNYDSRKGRELGGNPNAALVFYWKETGKQVRIEGIVEKISGPESDEYFASRPRGSQIAAWASAQSCVIGNKDHLVARVAGYREKFSGKGIPRPPNWGGYRLVPGRIEFWIAGEDRLHDRLVYLRNDTGWDIVRLSP